jgi:hypothetical protein
MWNTSHFRQEVPGTKTAPFCLSTTPRVGKPYDSHEQVPGTSGGKSAWHSDTRVERGRRGLGSAAMARLSYPQAGQPRPAALPPETRTVGQVVAESIRIYGEHFRPALLLGIGPAVLVVVAANVSRTLSFVLAPTLSAMMVSASFVGACVLVLDVRPQRNRLVLAWIVGWLVFIPVPFLALAFVLPGLAWLAAVGLVVPVLIVEELLPRDAFRRAWQLARAGYVHVLGSIVTLAIVVFLTQAVLGFILRGAGGVAISTAFFLANIVISPLLFIGSALLYVDQKARVQ